MSDSTTSAGPPSFSCQDTRGAAGSRKSSLRNSTPGDRAHVENVDRDHPALAVGRADALRRDLAPAAGRGAEIDHPRAGFQKTMPVVDLGKLEGGARAIAFAFGARDIRIVELAIEPQFGRQACASCRALTRVFTPRSRRAPDPVGAHHLDQHALAQTAIGNAQPPAGECAADRFQDGAAGEHEIGALGADTGIGDALLVSHGEQALARRRSLRASDIQQPSTRRRS